MQRWSLWFGTIDYAPRMDPGGRRLLTKEAARPKIQGEADQLGGHRNAADCTKKGSPNKAARATVYSVKGGLGFATKRQAKDRAARPLMSRSKAENRSGSPARVTSPRQRQAF